MRFLGFQFRNSHAFYCVDMSLLARVEDRVPFFAVPWSRKEILGLCRIRDWVLPVLDLRGFLEDERGGIGQSLLVVETPEGWLAYAVGALLHSIRKEEVSRVVRRDSAMVPYLLYTPYGLFHAVNLRIIVREHLKSLWTS